MEKCVTAAKTITPAVVVCELPPRAHTDCASDNIRHFNNELHSLAEKSECTFIRTSHEFLLRDNMVNNGYLENDLLHLNLHGSAKLVECLDIKLKDPASKQKVKKKAAYKEKSYSQALKTQATIQPPTNGSESAPQPCKKPQNSTWIKKPMMPPQSAPLQKIHMPLRNVEDGNATRVKPIQAEYGFCGYCG